MIEGLRLLPFVAELPIFDCDKCQNGDPTMNLQAQPEHARRLQGCPYLPALDGADTMYGVPLGVPFSKDWKKPSSCAGYLVSLPEVQEAVGIRPQWIKGGPAGVREYIGRGKDMTGDLGPALNAQAVLDGAIVTKQSHEMDTRAKEAEAKRGH